MDMCAGSEDALRFKFGEVRAKADVLREKRKAGRPGVG